MHFYLGGVQMELIPFWALSSALAKPSQLVPRHVARVAYCFTKSHNFSVLEKWKRSVLFIPVCESLYHPYPPLRYRQIHILRSPPQYIPKCWTNLIRVYFNEVFTWSRHQHINRIIQVLHSLDKPTLIAASMGEGIKPEITQEWESPLISNDCFVGDWTESQC